jgi:DNA mismatch endonuclease, patch repair protein
MSDVLTPEERQRNMSSIRGTNTKPELLIRKALHTRGFRYRLHRRDLPGTPDIVLPRYNAVIMVHGCFWHGHDCYLAKLPTTRAAFWKTKITRNAERDAQANAALRKQAWKIAIVWECALRGPKRPPLTALIDRLARFLRQQTRTTQEFRATRTTAS